MQELAESGAKVLNAQAVEFAKERGIAIYARATRGGEETVVRKLPPRAPGRVVGVASETGLVVRHHRRDGPLATLAALLERLDARGRSAASSCSSRTGRAAAAPARSCSSLENLHDFAALRARARAPRSATASSCARAWAPSPRSAPASTRTFTQPAPRAGRAARRTACAVLGVSTSSFRISFLMEEARGARRGARLHDELVTEGVPALNLRPS